MIEIACRYGKPVRIGVNWGSLDQDLLTRLMDENSRRPGPLDANDVMREAIVVSALESARRAEELGCRTTHRHFMQGERVQDLISSIATSPHAAITRCTSAHRGRHGLQGRRRVHAAMAVLLQEGIGDTIRVSLTPEPGGDRTREVIVAQEILQTMGLRSFTPMVVACPGCGRTTSTLFPGTRAEDPVHLRERMPEWASAILASSR